MVNISIAAPLCQVKNPAQRTLWQALRTGLYAVSASQDAAAIPLAVASQRLNRLFGDFILQKMG
jgi:hypothetical protein